MLAAALTPEAPLTCAGPELPLLLLLLSWTAGIITTPLPLVAMVPVLLLTSLLLVTVLLLLHSVSLCRHHHHAAAAGSRGHAGPGWRHADQDTDVC
jgi:hypothetical protein